MTASLQGPLPQHLCTFALQHCSTAALQHFPREAEVIKEERVSAMSGRVLALGAALTAATAVILAARPSPATSQTALDLERERASNSQKLAAIAERLDRLDGRLSKPDKGIET